MKAEECISVIIPTLNAAQYLPDLIPAILHQSKVLLAEIIIVDSMSSDNTVAIAKAFKKTKIVPINKFSHGRARNLGVRSATGDTIALLSQDALPKDSQWLIRLVEPLRKPGVAATYSRQLPREDANPMERFFLHIHFPAEAISRRKRENLTFEDVFFSNVSAAFKRNIMLQFPFDEELIMSEDQQFARDVLQAGYELVYTPESMVWHSHTYSLCSVFKRYFDSVYSLTRLFGNHDLKKSIAIGRRYLVREAVHMLVTYPLWLPYYVLYCAAKASATIAAHYADMLPRSLVRKISLHAYYWEV